MRIDPIFLERTRKAYAQCSTGKERKELLMQASLSCGISYSHFTRHMRLGELGLANRVTRKHSTKENLRLSELDRVANLVWNTVLEHSYGEYKIRRSAAFRVLERQGKIPQGITYKNISARIKKLGLSNDAQPIFRRWERSKPLELVQMDFSRSRYIEFISDKKTGEWKLRFRNPEYTRQEEERLWFGMAVDDATRTSYAHYFVTKGEDRDITQDLILLTFERKDEVDQSTGDIKGFRKLLQGMPEAIYVDQGPGFTESSTREGMKRFGIKLQLGKRMKDSIGRDMKQANKPARGKVEKKNGDLKDMFEAELFMEMGIGAEIGLNELNGRLEAWLEWFNACSHPTQREHKKWSMFTKCLDECDFPADDARMYFTVSKWLKVIKRTVKVRKNIWCRVPNFIDDGDMIEVVTHARSYYMLYKGERIRLEVLSSLDKSVQPTPMKPVIESPSDKLTGATLRKRLDEEVRKASEHTIRLADLPEDYDDDINYFCESPKSIEEIREQASAFIRLYNVSKIPKVITMKGVAV